MTPAADRPLTGLAWMVVTGLCFVALTVCVKYVGDRVPPAQSAFLRYALSLPVLFWMVGPIRRARLTRRQLGLFTLRGAAHTGAVVLWFYAMTRIPIAEVTAMNYLTPVYVTLGAALVLGEALSLRRLAAVVCALIGALVVLRPGMRELDPGHVAMLCVSVFFAAGYLLTKRLSGEVSATVIVGMLQITVTVGLLPFALMDWVAPTPGELALLALCAGFATMGHYAMTFAFAAAPISVTQPATFLQLVWAVTLGALLFGEAIDVFVILGGTIIVGSVSFIAWREARAKRLPPAVPAVQ